MPTERVNGYIWKSGKLKGKKASSYTRTAKPKKHSGVHKAERVKLVQQRFRDNQGRVTRTTMRVLND